MHGLHNPLVDRNVVEARSLCVSICCCLLLPVFLSSCIFSSLPLSFCPSLSISLCLYLSAACLPVSPGLSIPISLPLSLYLFFLLPIHLSLSLSLSLSLPLTTYLVSVFLSISPNLCISLFLRLSVSPIFLSLTPYLSFSISLPTSRYLSTDLSICLSDCLSAYRPISVCL